jgi:hypothetical protein
MVSMGVDVNKVTQKIVFMIVLMIKALINVVGYTNYRESLITIYVENKEDN